jgi:hypothetical protein
LLAVSEIMRQSLLASFDVDPYLFRWESVDICCSVAKC